MGAVFAAVVEFFAADGAAAAVGTEVAAGAGEAAVGGAVAEGAAGAVAEGAAGAAAEGVGGAALAGDATAVGYGGAADAAGAAGAASLGGGATVAGGAAVGTDVAATAAGSSLVNTVGKSAFNAGVSTAVGSLLAPKPPQTQPTVLPGGKTTTEPVPMPDPLAQEAASKRSIVEQLARRGRASTILTSPGSGKLGG